jgi:hypothetical protein
MWKAVYEKKELLMYVTPGRSRCNVHTFLRATLPSNKEFHAMLNLHLGELRAGG